MKTKWLKVVVALLVMTLVGNASALVYTWTGATGDGQWSTGSNWDQGAPPPPDSETVNVGDLTYGEVVTISSTTNATAGGDLHGPNWGQDLDIYGTLSVTGFVMAPVQWDKSNLSTINVFDGAQMDVVNMLLGDNWWYWERNVQMNVYDAQVNVSDWLWIGGNLNLFDGTVDVQGGVNVSTHWSHPYSCLNIMRGELIIRDGGTNASGRDWVAEVQYWIDQGWVKAWGQDPDGVTYIINVDSTSIPGGVILTAEVPEPASLMLLGLGALTALRKRK